MNRKESIKKWNQSLKGKISAKKYRKNTPKLFKKGGSAYKSKMIRYKKHSKDARNSKEEYTVADNELIISKSIPDIEIAKKLGRSLRAISNHRHILKNKVTKFEI